MDIKYDYTLSTDIQTEHGTWGKPYIKGSIKALFVPNVRFGREIVELIQRMDIEYDNVTIDRYWDLNRWGFGDFYSSNRGSIWDFDLMYSNLEKAVVSDEHYDVIVMPGINGWGHFTEKTRKALLDRIEKGAGLIMIQPFNGDGFEMVEELDILSPLKPLYNEGLNSGGRPKFAMESLKDDKWIPEAHYITKGIPFELFPYDEMGYYPYEAAGEVIVRSESGMPIAAVKQYGLGRIAAFGYFPRNILPQHIGYTGYDPCYEPIIENWHGARHSLNFNYLEYFYSLINRSIVWVSGKEPECYIENVVTKDNSLYIVLSDHGSLNLHYKIKNEYDLLIAEGQIEINKSASICLLEKINLGGRYRVDMFLKQDIKVMDWYTTVLNYPPVLKIEEIRIDRQVVKPGEQVSGSILAKGNEGIVEIQVVDDYDRIIDLKRHPVAGDCVINFDFAVEEMRSIHCKVRVIAEIEGHIVHQMESDPFIVSPPDRQLKDFEVFMCPINRGQGDLLELERKRMLEMGVTGLFLGDNKLSTLSGADELFITWNDRWPYVESKELYLKTRDKKYLYREPCLNDPKLWEDNEKKIISTVKQNSRFCPISYFANDEGSLTCYTDELDLDFSPACIAEMQEWLKGEYESLDELNVEWNTSFKSWEDVVPYTYLEAIKTGDYASWGDHRRFMSLTFANTYKKLRDYIQMVDPEGVVRISGTQKTTPYSGYDYYMLHQYIGYFEAYSVGNQYELHRSFARPGTIIGSWVGYGYEGSHVWNQIWKSLLHGVTLLSIFWEFSCLNPDFTFSRSAVDMGKAFREIKREGIGKLLLYSAHRDSLGIGIHYSMSSIHGTYIRHDFTRYEDNVIGWIELLEDLGYQYNFVATPQIEAGELIRSGYKLFILPYSIAISKKEAEELKKFADQGGVVIGDIQTGIMDQHCRLYDKGSLDELFGIERYTTDTQSFYLDNEFSIVKDFPYFKPVNLYGTSELAMIEYGTRENAGNAAYVQDFSKAAAAVVINRFGKGKGVYLNFALNQYPTVRKEKSKESMTRKLMKDILSVSGVEKFLEIQDSNDNIVESGYEIICYNDNQAEYVALLKDMESNIKTGYDGIGIAGFESGTSSEKAINRAVFKNKSHVYDIRSQEYLGFTDQVTLSLEAGAAKLFSLMPFKLEGIEISPVGCIGRGELLDISGSLDIDKEEAYCSHTLSIQFYDPLGEYSWVYSENITLEGNHFARSYRLPFNERTGTWKVIVKDAATGVKAVQEFQII